MSIYVDNQLKYTYTEFALFPDDGQRHEIIDGDHYVSPPPNTFHQTVSRRIQFDLYTQIERAGKGVVFDAPTGVELTETDIVQPDLILVGSYHRHIVAPRGIIGVPDLIVEILSPSNPRHDTQLKRSVYERVGVPEYWIVDPDAHHIEQLVLGSDRRYRDMNRKTDSITVAVACFAGVTVDLTQVWQPEA